MSAVNKTNMEKTAAKKTAKSEPKSKIIAGYLDYVLEHGKEPASVYKFAKELKMKEEEFYGYFTSFEAIKSAVWGHLFDTTINNLESQEVYKEYSAREKLLGFLFTLVEEMKKNRSYLLSLYGSKRDLKNLLPAEVKTFRSKFKDFANELILEGKETEEIANRPVITERYDEALWLQVWFVFQFWLKDSSVNFEKTDAAIEKSVNLAFDLMGKSALDTFLDFAKFLYQNK
jgi:AcrR family transcriptional regulator